jgi:hypothetical protein
MNVKRTLLFCAVVFFAIIGVLIWRSDKVQSPPDKRDPSSLPAPSKAFDDWRKQFEKQRF